MAFLAALIGGILAGGGALFFAWVDQVATAGGVLVWSHAPWFVWIILPGGLALVLFLRDRYFSGTDGTGIPQTIAALDLGPGPMRDELLSLRVAAGKALLTSIALCSFLSIGREGPSVQLGACFMNWGSRWTKFPRHLLERGLILGGGAAGIAAAFNAPMAGIVFSFEEIGRRFDKENMGTIVRSVGLACLVVLAVMGNHFFYGRIGYDRLLPLEFTRFSPWGAVLLIGVMGGALGGAFARLLLLAIPTISRQIKKRFGWVALVFGLVCAGLAFVSSGQTLGTGYVQTKALILQDSPEFLATLPLAEQEQLHQTLAELSPWYPLQRAAVSFLVLLTGIPGGLFDPSFSVGAGLGHATAGWLAFTGASPQAIIMLWVVAYFSGVVQSPMTSFIILIEMTGAIAFTVPLLFVSVIAYEVSRRICPVSLYEALAER